jgi:hypothetical protein
MDVSDLETGEIFTTFFLASSLAAGTVFVEVEVEIIWS